MKTDPRFLLLASCFVLSGAAGLLYQTAWTEQFALVFGTSELAVVTVLSAYMAGLALGAALAARWEHRVRRPVRTYAFLEAGIAAAALAVQPAISVAGRVHVALAGGRDSLPGAEASGAALYYLVSSFAILLVPTALMGATLPLLVRHCVRREIQIGRRVGLLYSANAIGAAAGTVATAFLLLPTIGLGRTLLVGASTNLLVFALAWFLARTGTEPESGAAADQPGHRPGFHWILPAVLVSGAVSFTCEVLWTRLLSHLIGGSVYAFATMLATFLTGIALGSAVAARLATSPIRARGGFAASQLAVAATSLAAFAAVSRLAAAGSGPAAEGGGGYGAMVCAALLLPMTVAIGATFPFAVRILAHEARGAAPASARVFAWNTAGAISGALLAGYLVLPAWRYEGTAAAVAATSLLLAAVVAMAGRPRWTLLVAASVAGLVLLAFVGLSAPWPLLRHSPLDDGNYRGDVAFYAVGRSATVTLFENPTVWRLTTNGLPESSIERAGVRPGRQAVARWLSLLPVAVRPETRSLLVVGLGAGLTVEEVPASVAAIDVVELESEVVRANRAMASRRRKDPLADPRTTVHVNDARGALRLTRRRFDAVVSQPSHPWTSGASHLFTREFFVLVRERLSDGGVFVQWMGLPFVDESLLRSLVATALEVFPQVEVYQPLSGAVLILASRQPLDVAATAERGLDVARREWTQLGIFYREDLEAARVLDVDGARRFAAGAPVSTDFYNLVRTRSPHARRRPLREAGADRLFAPHDPLLTRLEETDHRLYLVRRLIRNGQVRRARRLAEALPDLVERSTGIGLVEMAAGRGRRAGREFHRALDLDSGCEEALFALAALHRPGTARGGPATLPPRVQAALLSRPREGPAAAVADGWRLEAAGDWRASARLEDRLAGVEPRHPLFVDATRLRIGWRVASGDPGRAREALALADRLLSSPSAPDLLLRARAALAAGQPRFVLAAVGEALPRLAGADEARKILRELPVDDELESWRQDLLSRLEAKAARR